MFEGLGWCLVAEAFSRCLVHACHDVGDFALRQRSDVKLTRQEAPQSEIEVLDASLLPWRSRVAEVGFDTSAMVFASTLEQAEVGELRASVEGDRLRRLDRQPFELCPDGRHHSPGFLVRLFHDQREVGLPFDHGGVMRGRQTAISDRADDPPHQERRQAWTKLPSKCRRR